MDQLNLIKPVAVTQIVGIIIVRQDTHHLSSAFFYGGSTIHLITPNRSWLEHSDK